MSDNISECPKAGKHKTWVEGLTSQIQGVPFRVDAPWFLAAVPRSLQGTSLGLGGPGLVCSRRVHWERLKTERGGGGERDISETRIATRLNK